jgi:hypothetical protein
MASIQEARRFSFLFVNPSISGTCGFDMGTLLSGKSTTAEGREEDWLQLTGAGGH